MENRKGIGIFEDGYRYPHYHEQTLLELDVARCPCSMIRSQDAPNVINYAKYESNAIASGTFKQNLK